MYNSVQNADANMLKFDLRTQMKSRPTYIGKVKTQLFLYFAPVPTTSDCFYNVAIPFEVYIVDLPMLHCHDDPNEMVYFSVSRATWEYVM